MTLIMQPIQSHRILAEENLVHNQIDCDYSDKCFMMRLYTNELRNPDLSMSERRAIKMDIYALQLEVCNVDGKREECFFNPENL